MATAQQRLDDNPARQMLLDAGHKRLHALDPAEFLY